MDSSRATRSRVAAPALSSSVRTRSMTSSQSSANLAMAATAATTSSARVKAPLPSRSTTGAGLKRTTSSMRSHSRGPEPSTRKTPGSGVSRTLRTARPMPASSTEHQGGHPTSSTAFQRPTSLSPQKSMIPVPTSPVKRMPLTPKSPQSTNIPPSARTNPFDLTSPGKREAMVSLSPPGRHDAVRRQLFAPTLGPSEPPQSTGKRPRSPEAIFLSSPQRLSAGALQPPPTFLQPPASRPRFTPSSSPSALDEDIAFPSPWKKFKYDASDDDEALRPPLLETDAMDVDLPRPPSSEGLDIASHELASPRRLIRQPGPLIFGASLMATPSRAAVAPPPIVPTISTTQPTTTTPPCSPPKSPYRVPRPLGSVFGTMVISPRRVSPIKEATMPTDIPLRSPSPEKVFSPPPPAVASDDMPTSRFLNPFPIFAPLPPLPPPPPPVLTTRPQLQLSRSGPGLTSLESITEEERSPVKSTARPALPPTASQQAPPPAAAPVTRSSTLKSKYRGLAGATIPRPAAPQPPATTTAATPAAPNRALTGRPRTSNAAPPPPPMSSSSSSAPAPPFAVRATETNDRLAKLQAMLDKMSSGRPTAGLSSSTNASSQAPSTTTTTTTTTTTGGVAAGRGARTSLAGRGMPTSTSTSAVSALASSTTAAGRRRSNSSGSSTAGPASLLSSRSGPPSSLKLSTNGGGTRRVSQILPSSTSFARLDASTGREVEMRPREGPLVDVVAFVDVRTAEGDDAGQVFVEMLKGLGAKVLTRPTYPLTHIVFKGGKPGTIDKWSCHPDPKPWIVGIGWVVRCREVMARAAENPYVVEITKEAVTGKRRKSMEPKALALANAGLSISTSGPPPPPAGRPNLVASIEQAKRKSLQFAPKIGSPLAKRMFDASSLLIASDEDS